jgi:UPF0042 nucleotide-binding protein
MPRSAKSSVTPGSSKQSTPAPNVGRSVKSVSVRNANQLAQQPKKPGAKELVIITGISGSGKGSALKALEDLGYYAVDNLPLELLPHFANLIKKSPEHGPLEQGLSEIDKAVIVVDVREGPTLELLPTILLKVKKTLHTSVVFLDASDAVLVRRFSETRRPHPLSRSEMVARSITSERQLLDEVRNLADFIVDTSGFNVHELRAYMQAKFGPQNGDSAVGSQLLVSCLSFGFKNGVPLDADLVFDVRFLPNPHFVPEFRKLTGRNPKVAKFVRDFPQTTEFLTRVTEMMLFLLPHYIKEGKSYLTIAFGCTGGQHRSVMMAEEMAKRLGKAGFKVKAVHRDMPR